MSSGDFDPAAFHVENPGSFERERVEGMVDDLITQGFVPPLVLVSVGPDCCLVQRVAPGEVTVLLEHNVERLGTPPESSLLLIIDAAGREAKVRLQRDLMQ